MLLSSITWEDFFNILVGQKALYDNASFKRHLGCKNVIKFLSGKTLVAGLPSFSLAFVDETSNAVGLIILAHFIPSFQDIYDIWKGQML